MENLLAPIHSFLFICFWFIRNLSKLKMNSIRSQVNDSFDWAARAAGFQLLCGFPSECARCFWFLQFILSNEPRRLIDLRTIGHRCEGLRFNVEFKHFGLFGMRMYAVCSIGASFSAFTLCELHNVVGERCPTKFTVHKALSSEQRSACIRLGFTSSFLLLQLFDPQCVDSTPMKGSSRGWVSHLLVRYCALSLLWSIERADTSTQTHF